MIETWLQALPHGIHLSCRASGTPGRPVLLFLHGFPEAAFVWDELLEHFTRPENGGYRCVAPNLRGYERSSAPPEPAAYRAKHLVQDIAALIAVESPGQPLACLVAHDWGGAVAWNLANQQPALIQRLAILNSPHPGTFLRELKNNPKQQAASAYMNFLIRPDAEALLAEDDYRRLWDFFLNLGAGEDGYGWLTDELKERYRAVWDQGLTGGLNYYRASPLRPPRPEDAAASQIELPREMLTIAVPTLVLWGLGDTALPPELIEGLEDYIPQLTLERVPEATHWIVHEQAGRVIQALQRFLAA
ncbi:alpha/beta fold hydrolase [Hylemonella gracilis]|uniref:Alpha/beta hydrolase n=1 Tax=Hylemonella gracilis ATCC 19624 TaxID=887062 RepID=F3KTB3_9BURK|nr:alpha/beta hydrolase [Hylemonella gracilis]EGI77014.1 alpha/beta hydrolase [Hylemonella gracilis ATCC 19624]